jgi:coronin-7
MWDTKSGLTKLKSQSVDCGTSVLTANYDVDTEVLFVTGRVSVIMAFKNKANGSLIRTYFINFQGDSTVKLFEMKSDAPYFSELTPFVMPEQHRGICLVPKAGLDVMSAEVDRLLKVTANAVIPIRFTVPRKVLYPTSLSWCIYSHVIFRLTVTSTQISSPRLVEESPLL